MQQLTTWADTSFILPLAVVRLPVILFARAEITHLLCKGKYHCTVDLLFDRLGFGQASKSVYSFNSTKQLNPNKSNRRSAKE